MHHQGRFEPSTRITTPYELTGELLLYAII